MRARQGQGEVRERQVKGLGHQHQHQHQHYVEECSPCSSSSSSCSLPSRPPCVVVKHRRELKPGGLGRRRNKTQDTLRNEGQRQRQRQNENEGQGERKDGDQLKEQHQQRQQAPRRSKAELAKQIKALTDGSAKLNLSHLSHLNTGHLEKHLEESLGEVEGDIHESESKNVASVSEEKEKEESLWARKVWFTSSGHLLRDDGVSSKDQVLSTSSSTIFCKDMLSSEEWTKCQRFTVYDVGLLIRSRLVQQRCFAYDLIKGILGKSHQADEKLAHCDSFQYFVRQGLYDALLVDSTSSNARGCHYSLSLLSDILLPTPLAEYLAQKKCFGAFVRNSNRKQSGKILQDFEGDIAVRVSKVCRLGTILQHNDLSQQVVLAVVKIMIALELRGIWSYLASCSSFIISFLSAKIESGELISLKLHIVWLLLLISERDAKLVSENVDRTFPEVLGKMASATKFSESYHENALQSFILQFCKAHLSSKDVKLARKLTESARTNFDFGAINTTKLSNGDCILVGNLFSMLSDNTYELLIGGKTEMSRVDHLISGIKYLEFLLLQVPKTINESGDRILYYICALTQGVSFYKHLKELEREGGCCRNLLNPLDDLDRSMNSILPGLMGSLCAVYKNLLYQDIKDGKLLQGLNLGPSDTKLSHSTWHTAISNLLSSLLELSSNEEFALDLAWNILTMHRAKTFVVDIQEDSLDVHGVISLLVDSTHYELLCLAIDIFGNSSRVGCSVDSLVVTWDCAAEAIFRSDCTHERLSMRSLFSSKFLCGILGKCDEILEMYMPNGNVLSAFEMNRDSSVVDPESLAKYMASLDSDSRASKSSPLSPGWMYDLDLCASQIQFYPLILLFLLCLELCGSRYLLGLPVNLKLSKILNDAYCKNNSLFKEESCSLMPQILGHHISGLEKEVYNLRLSTQIIDQFASISCRDRLFGLSASLSFSNAQSPSDRLRSWKSICSLECFNLFPSVTYYEKLMWLFFGSPTKIELVEACFESLVLGSNSMKRALDEGCITGYFALHIVSEFCFGESRVEEMSVLQKQHGTLANRKKDLVHRALAFMREDILVYLFKYSFDGKIPSVARTLDKRKVSSCRAITGSLPNFLEDLEVESM